MLGLARRLLGILLVVALIAPAAAALCAGGACAPGERAEHGCCATPALTDCGCVDAAAVAENDTEPARRDGGDPMRHAVMSARWMIDAPAQPTFVSPAAITPPRDTGGRLSLLSILIV